MLSVGQNPSTIIGDSEKLLVWSRSLAVCKKVCRICYDLMRRNRFGAFSYESGKIPGG
jgi:hypothetical protein